MSGPEPSPLRVAVASSDGVRVDRHLGRTERLFIFAAAPGGPLLEGRRPALPDGPSGHDPRRLSELTDLLADCAAVLALQVGPGLRQELERRGIRVLTGEGPITPLLERIGASYLARAPRAQTKKYRIAIASADGKYVHLHFGRATEFQIFDVEGDRRTFVERRPSPALCQGGEHDLGRMLQVIIGLRDCQAVLAVRIGPQVRQALIRFGIHPFAIPDTIPSALRQIRATGFPGVVSDPLS